MFARKPELTSDDTPVNSRKNTAGVVDLDESSLIFSVQHFLALQGLAFSVGAIRDLPEISGESFDVGSAISALGHVGYEAKIGRLKPKRLKKSLCPAIGFTFDNQAVVIEDIDREGNLIILKQSGESKKEELARSKLRKLLRPYFIVVRKSVHIGKLSQENWFWGSLSEGRWQYFQVIVAASIANFLGLSTSLFIMVVYDRVVPNEAIESLLALTIGVLIALSFDFLIKMLRAQFVDKAGKKADKRMSRLIFQKIINLGIAVRTRNSGAMASIVREFDTLRDFFTSATLIAVVDLPFIFFFIWVISLIAGPLAIVPLIAVPLVVFSGLIIQPFLAKIAKETMESGMSKQAVLVETLNGIETIQATGSGRLMRKRFEEASNSQSDLGLKNRMLSQFAINSAASIQQFAQVATIFFGVFLIKDGEITMGAMIAAVILGGRTLAPLSQLASAMSRANGARQAYKTLSSVMKQEPQTRSNGPKLSRPILKGNIEFQNVSFTYPSSKTPIIQNLTLKITEGQRVAVIGRMGSGKSTFARLASGLLEPTEGSVLFDGIDMRQIERADVRRNLGVMLQDAWLFSGSVKENLQMGYYEYDDNHLLNISKISGVDDFIGKHPSGYDFQLKEKGEGLSGGQKQTINLARSLLHNPNILVLDEPTSSMDTATEKLVLTNLKAWSNEKTIIAVTHRNSILDIADRVLIFDTGKIIADTTPAKMRRGN
jgi:ATP-binding cassette, subfamily C, bacterial LapB